MNATCGWRDISAGSSPPAISNGLNGRSIKVVVKTLEGFVEKTEKNGVQVYQGALIDLLHELSVYLNFSYTIQEAPDDSWGQTLPDGQWDGPIGVLARKEADLAVGYFTLTASRSSVADATTPYMHTRAVIIFKTEPLKSSAWSFFLQPFQTEVYLAIVTCLVMVPILLLLLNKFPWRTQRPDPPETERGGRGSRNVLGRLESMLSALFSAPVDCQRPRSRAVSILDWSWLMLGVVLTSVYGSMLTSSLAVSQQALPFSSLAELLDQDTFTWGVRSGTALESLLKNSTNRLYQKYYQGVLRFADTDPDVLSPDSDVQAGKLARGKFALFQETLLLYHIPSASVCNLAYIPETYMTTALCFYLQKSSPYTRLISDGIGRMVDAGLVDYWRRKWQPERRNCDPDVFQQNRAIVLSDVQSAFYLAGAGLGIGMIALSVEGLIYCNTNKKRMDMV